MLVDFEKSFVRALTGVCLQSNLLLGFSSLSLCGVISVLCQCLASRIGFQSGLLFFPVFFSFGVLLACGVLVTQSYMQGGVLNSKKIVLTLLKSIPKMGYLSWPPIVAWLALSTVLGVFFLFSELPLMGPLFSVLFSSIPFLVVLGFTFLCLAQIGVLFFVVPCIAHHPIKRFSQWRVLFKDLREQPLRMSYLLFLGVLPCLVMAIFVGFSLNLTVDWLSPCFALRSFFIVLPCAALFTPPLIFFFHFAAESYLLIRR